MELGRFLLVLLAATLLLNLDSLHYTPLYLWPQVLPPVLMIVGVAGSIFGLRSLRLVGWAGIVLFSIIAFATSFPSEDARLLGNPVPGFQEITIMTIAVRLVVALTMTISLTYCYRKLRTASKADLQGVFS